MSATFPASTTLESLGLQPGDSLVVEQIHDGTITVAVTRHEPRPPRPSAKEFLDKWAGKIPMPDPVDDPRLADIIAKHVK